ncbi:MAG: 16S rRNA (guanine(966)-N(2))-methyltransferase RsmD [Oscillospiraceae bacterium]|nr:16S rRNA (guanine(966)-N(2))-methyltransferase RsmD [Oscillospiraceae bacterium]
MRIITGSAKGKRLKTVEGVTSRPTGDKIKEAIFSVIQFDVENAVVLDLFAGSGQLGIEALSRGARSAYFNDAAQSAVVVIHENLQNTGLSDKAHVSRQYAEKFLRNTDNRFDIAFVDPPYNIGLVNKVLPKLIEKMHPDGIIICEHEKELTLPENIEIFNTDKTYRHGSTSVTIYRGTTTNENSDLSGEL